MFREDFFHIVLQHLLPWPFCSWIKLNVLLLHRHRKWNKQKKLEEFLHLKEEFLHLKKLSKGKERKKSTAIILSFIQRTFLRTYSGLDLDSEENRAHSFWYHVHDYIHRISQFKLNCVILSNRKRLPLSIVRNILVLLSQQDLKLSLTLHYSLEFHCGLRNEI